MSTQGHSDGTRTRAWITRGGLALAAALLLASGLRAAETVPTDIQLPGTQPGEASQIESVTKCDNCHGNYDLAVEPAFNWSGSMMAHAARDPIFWATVAIAEQDFDGSGDLCIRCHVGEGWLAGRSTPTDGSNLAEGDDDGVQCDICHRVVNPDGSEHAGVQNAPFLAHDGGSPATGYYGSGMYVLSDGNAKLGPYDDATARHQFLQSQYHRSEDLCGTCHDVSNPAVGDLAHNNGAQTPLDPGTFSGVPGAPVDQKAAFNNFPYQYGVVERTTSEHKASLWSTTRVQVSAQNDCAGIPSELNDGAVKLACQAASLAGNGGDYEDGTPRYFTCQSCHMRPTIGQGCDKNPPVRGDLPLHDMTGGNYWMPDALQWMDTAGMLILGGGLTQFQKDALDAGKLRARETLSSAASLTLSGNALTITNLTGHKLITGYPEGRRMWLRVAWYDDVDTELAEDGEYDTLLVDIDQDGQANEEVETLLDLHPPYTPIYEAHAAMTQEWANQLLGLGYPGTLPLSFDRVTGDVTHTLADLGAQAPGTYHETFHFVLNNKMAKDNRIPPWGMNHTDAVTRNIVPVPPEQYGGVPGGGGPPGGIYDHWDTVALNPPPDADHATVDLLYQPTSWEYIQFLELANTGQSTFLANEGTNLRLAWVATDMAEPHVMATLDWQATTPGCSDGLDNDGDGLSDFPADPGCTSATDVSENEAGRACDDRADNDGDGYVDMHDPQCLDPLHPTELPTQCSDGIDNDGDGDVDYPADPGCINAASNLEGPQCDDDLDNDGDGKIDWDGGPLGIAEKDLQCNDNPTQNREKKKSCGIGFELVLVLLPIAWLGRRRWS